MELGSVGMLVEVFTFEGCPHASGALQLARTMAAEIDGAEVRRVDLDERQTDAARFLGSPSIRVNGRGIEPGAEMRRDFAYSCRLYATERGLGPLPDERWLRNALDASAEGHSSTDD